jgi:tetratricopeptide (TPR) repeat protein
MGVTMTRIPAVFMSRRAAVGSRILAAVLLIVLGLSAGCATLSLVETIEALLKQAKELLDAKRYDEALTKLVEVIRRDPVQWKAYLYTAQAYIGKSDWGQALANARKALELAPREPDTVTVLGESLFGAGVQALGGGAFRDAAGYFVEYIKLRPTDGQGYLNAGRAYLGAGSWAEAGRVLVDGLARTGDAGTRRPLAQALLDGGRQALARGDHQGAAGLLREYVRQDPRDVAAYLDLGKAYWNSGERAEALGAFRRVLELAPGNAEALRFLRGQ